MSQEYNGLEESLKRLDMLSFDQSVFLNKAKIMYKVYNNLAPNYSQELFHMRDVNLNNTASNLRSVAQSNYIVPQAKCNLFKSSHTFFWHNYLEQYSLKDIYSCIFNIIRLGTKKLSSYIWLLCKIRCYLSLDHRNLSIRLI